MLSKKSKIEQLQKSRESRFSAASAAASLCRTRTKLCGCPLVIRCDSSRRRTHYAPAMLKNFVHLPEKPFSTASARLRGFSQVPKSVWSLGYCRLPFLTLSSSHFDPERP